MSALAPPPYTPPIAEQSAYPSRLVCRCGRPRADRAPTCPEHAKQEMEYTPGGITAALWPEFDDLIRAIIAHDVRCMFAGEDLPLTELYRRFPPAAVHAARQRVYEAERARMLRWIDTPEKVGRLDALDAYYFDVLFPEST